MKKLLVILSLLAILSGCISSNHEYAITVPGGSTLDSIQMPVKIKDYIGKNFPSEKVVTYSERKNSVYGIEKAEHYHIVLGNGKELSFDANGNILK